MFVKISVSVFLRDLSRNMNIFRLEDSLLSFLCFDELFNQQIIKTNRPVSSNQHHKTNLFLQQWEVKRFSRTLQRLASVAHFSFVFQLYHVFVAFVVIVHVSILNFQTCSNAIGSVATCRV